MDDPFLRLERATNRTYGAPVTHFDAFGASRDLVWSFWESPSATKLSEVTTAHEGPIAQIMLADFPDRPSIADEFQAGTRRFSVLKAAVSRSGLYWIVELSEKRPL